MASKRGLLLIIKIGNDFTEGFESLFYFLNQVKIDKNLNIAGIVTIGYHSNIRAQYVLSILKNMNMERKIPLIVGPGSFYNLNFNDSQAKKESRNQFLRMYPDYPIETLGMPFTICDEKTEKLTMDLFDKYDIENHVNKFKNDDSTCVDFFWKLRIEHILEFHSESNPLTVVNIGDCTLLEMLNPILFKKMRLFLYTGVNLDYEDANIQDEEFVVDNNKKLIYFTHNVFKNKLFLKNIKNFNMKTYIMSRNFNHLTDADNKQDLCGEFLIKCALEFSKGHDIMEKQHIKIFYDNMNFLVKQNKTPSSNDCIFSIMKIFLNEKDKKELFE